MPMRTRVEGLVGRVLLIKYQGARVPDLRAGVWVVHERSAATIIVLRSRELCPAGLRPRRSWAPGSAEILET